jgi:hypothetical protein
MPVDLSHDKVESLINEISLGGKIVSVAGSNKGLVTVFVSHCTGLDKMCADLEYEQAYEKAISDGFLTAGETRKCLIGKGYSEQDVQKEIEVLESKIKGQEAYLSKLTRVPARRRRVIDNINRMKKELEGLLLRKEEGLEYSAERVAIERKYLYMTWRGTKNPYTRELYWPTKESFDSEKDLTLSRNIFLEIIKLSSGMDVSVLRYLARSNAWRIRYLTSVKTGESLFGTGIQDYTTDQLSLSYWSHYYQSVYEMLPEDRPAESLIEDDAALDAYMRSYMEETGREAAAARESKKKGEGVKSAWDHGETLVMRSNPVYEDVEYSETVEAIRNKSKSDIKEQK